MGGQTNKTIENLALKLGDYRSLDPTERHFFLLWAITRAVGILGGKRPILVGGGAVEFYTGMRFATWDLDLITPSEELTKEALKELGFQESEEDNLYVNRNIGALVHLHGERLWSNETTVEVIYRKVPLLLVAPEDCIVERLTAYRRYGSSLDFLNAFLIAYHNADRLDVAHLQERIGALDLWEYYRPIQHISRGLICHFTGVDEAASELIHFLKREPN